MAIRLSCEVTTASSSLKHWGGHDRVAVRLDYFDPVEVRILSIT